MTPQRAIIDIGSNTVRLVVYGGPERAPVTIHNEKVAARLGRDLDRSGAIPEKAFSSAISALARHAALLRLLDVKDVQCVATAAARDATNGPEFVRSVRALGLDPRLLSGEEEAHASATGVIAAFPGARGIAADLGGGSLELVEIADGKVQPGGVSMPFGTLRLKDLRGGGGSHFAATIRAGIRKTGWDRAEGQTLYIVGGSWRALALQIMSDLHWPVDDPHGFELDGTAALDLARRYAKAPPRRPDPRISSARLGTLCDAAALLVQVIARLKPERLVFSSWGLREGLLHAALPPAAQAQDPLLAGVAAFAGSQVITPDRTRAIAKWCAPACEDRPEDGTMRMAATMLAMAAMRSEPNLRLEEAMSWTLRKRWVGLDMQGRAMLAMTVFANSGRTNAPEPLLRLASQPDLDRAITWGLAVRLCRRLTMGNPAAMAEALLERDDKALVLTLADDMRPLYNSNVSKDMRALAERLGLEARIVDGMGQPIG